MLTLRTPTMNWNQSWKRLIFRLLNTVQRLKSNSQQTLYQTRNKEKLLPSLSHRVLLRKGKNRKRKRKKLVMIKTPISYLMTIQMKITRKLKLLRTILSYNRVHLSKISNKAQVKVRQTPRTSFTTLTLKRPSLKCRIWCVLILSSKVVLCNQACKQWAMRCKRIFQKKSRWTNRKRKKLSRLLKTLVGLKVSKKVLAQNLVWYYRNSSSS